MRTVTVIGGNEEAMAFAAYLVKRGYFVKYCPSTIALDTFNQYLIDGQLSIETDLLERIALPCVMENPEIAVTDSEWIFIIAEPSQQITIFEKIYLSIMCNAKLVTFHTCTDSMACSSMKHIFKMREIMYIALSEDLFHAATTPSKSIKILKQNTSLIMATHPNPIPNRIVAKVREFLPCQIIENLNSINT